MRMSAIWVRNMTLAIATCIGVAGCQGEFGGADSLASRGTGGQPPGVKAKLEQQQPSPL